MVPLSLPLEKLAGNPPGPDPGTVPSAQLLCGDLVAAVTSSGFVEFVGLNGCGISPLSTHGFVEWQAPSATWASRIRDSNDSQSKMRRLCCDRRLLFSVALAFNRSLNLMIDSRVTAEQEMWRRA